MCQKTWKDEIITKIYVVSEVCCEFLERSTVLPFDIFSFP